MSLTVPTALGVPELMQRFGIPGVSMAVIEDFEIAWAEAWGVADVATGAPVSVETRFQAASMSKPVAAMAMLRAVQDGAFGLDQDVNTILKSWKLPMGGYEGPPVTPRMLLSHTSGLGDGFGFPGYPPGQPLPSLVEILDGLPPSALGPVRLAHAAMTLSQYSGGGFVLQELALADALGRPFEEIATSEVLEPIGMTRSTFAQPLPPELEREAACAHDASGAREPDPWRIYPERSAAGLWTTPTDLAKFLIEVQLSLRGRSNRVLDQLMARELITPVGVGSFAVGFEIEQRGGEAFFRHGGSNRGFKGAMLADAAEGRGLVVMTNGDNGAGLVDELALRIFRTPAV